MESVEQVETLVQLERERCDDLLEAVPNLRRYAFCLVGRKDEGDTLVEGTLNRISSNGALLNGASCSVSLFKVFNADQDVVAACRNAHQRNAGAVGDALHGAILNLPLKLRQVLILVRTLEFSCEDTAEIVPCPTTDVAHSVSEAVDRILKNTDLYQHGFAQCNGAMTREPPQVQPG